MAADPKQQGNSRPSPAIAPTTPPTVAPEEATTSIEQTDTPVAKDNPFATFVPDPLPPLNRPIFEQPDHPRTHTLALHPGQVNAHMEAAVEEVRMRLGEMREFLKRFHHDVGGDLGDLINHLRVSLGVPRPDPARDARRRDEDAMVAASRRAQDLAGPPSTATLHRRAEEDAGLAVSRRIQDTSPPV